MCSSDLCLIVEVLSDSTAAYDRGGKFAAYRRLELFRREPVGWVLHEPEGEGDAARLPLTSIGLELSAADAFGDLQA